MNPQLKKAKRWFGRATILVAVIATLVAFLPKFPTNWSLGNITFFKSPKVTEQSFYLEAGEWSEWISTPPNSKYRIDPTVPVRVCFIDTSCHDVYPSEYKKPTWFGLRRGIFKVWSPEPATILVTIER